MREIRKSSVCVVGGAGFLGSHLVDYLIEECQCRVLVLDNLVAGRREFINPKALFEHCDITGSEEHLLKLFRTYMTQYVFNYAAEPYIPTSFKRPVHVLNVNAFGALKVINAAQEVGCEAILQVSSAEIYGERAIYHVTADGEKIYRPINEKSPIIPHSSYGAAKAAIDAMVQVRWREAGTPVISLRQFNSVGERETHPYVIPEIISQLYRSHNRGKDHAKIKLGNNSTRDFLYAGDAVRMAVELLEKGKFGEVYNLGSEVAISIYDLAQKIALISGCGSCETITDPSRIRPWEIWHLQSDNSKIYSVIEGRPKVSLDEALGSTIGYFNENGRKWCWE